MKEAMLQLLIAVALAGLGALINLGIIRLGRFRRKRDQRG